MSTGTKRSHSKSRTGCKQCKLRRIKCDETPPRCQNCVKKGSQCEYQDFKDAFEHIRLLTPANFERGSSSGNVTGVHTPQGPAPRNNMSSPTSSSPADSRSGSSGGFELSPTYNISDLGYMHHWSVYTFQTMPILYDEYNQTWQYQVPIMAQSHPDLMHGVLALAAAHQQTLAPAAERDPQRVNEVRQHYSKALNYFLTRGRNIRAEDSDVLLCFVYVISMLTTYLDQQKPADECSALSEFLSLANVVRNAMGMLHPIAPALLATPVGALILCHSPTQQRRQLDLDTLLALDNMDAVMARYLKTPAGSQEDHAVLAAAVTRLRDCLELVPPNPHVQRSIMPWLTGIGPEFCSLVQRRHPMALCVMLLSCATCMPPLDFWWVGDWRTRLVAEVRAVVGGTEWAEALAWPMQRILGQGQGGGTQGNL